MDCAAPCSRCGTKMGSARSFATATTMSWPCYKKHKMVKCDVCGHEKGSDKFKAALLEHNAHHGRKVVCIQCGERGYSPADVRSYQCQGNGGHACGHLAFPRQALKHAKQRSSKMRYLFALTVARAPLRALDATRTCYRVHPTNKCGIMVVTKSELAFADGVQQTAYHPTM